MSAERIEPSSEKPFPLMDLLRSVNYYSSDKEAPTIRTIKRECLFPVGVSGSDFPFFHLPNGQKIEPKTDSTEVDIRSWGKCLTDPEEKQAFSQFCQELKGYTQILVLPAQLFSAAYEAVEGIRTRLSSGSVTREEAMLYWAACARDAHTIRLTKILDNDTLSQKCFLFSVWCYLQSV